MTVDLQKSLNVSIKLAHERFASPNFSFFTVRQLNNFSSKKEAKSVCWFFSWGAEAHKFQLIELTKKREIHKWRESSGGTTCLKSTLACAIFKHFETYFWYEKLWTTCDFDIFCVCWIVGQANYTSHETTQHNKNSRSFSPIVYISFLDFPSVKCRLKSPSSPESSTPKSRQTASFARHSVNNRTHKWAVRAILLHSFKLKHKLLRCVETKFMDFRKMNVVYN